MYRGTRTGKTALLTVIKILIVIALTALLAVVALIGAVFVIARGPSGEAAERLAATLTESSSPLAGIFFTYDELEASKFYMPPAQVPSGAVFDAQLNDATVVSTPVRGNGWSGYVITGIRPDRLKFTAKNSGVTGSVCSLGLDDYVDAVLYDGTLTYVGEDAVYCACAMSPDGLLHIGAMTAYDAANSGYVWAISAPRVLVEAGVPCSGLGGGYAARAAIGQCADGSLILIFTERNAFYPSGVTYSELAALMYEHGAVTAAALAPEGGLRLGGDIVTGNRMTPGFSLVVSGGGDAQ